MDHRKNIEFNDNEISILLEAPEDLVYKLALEISRCIGSPMNLGSLKNDNKRNSAVEYKTVFQY